MYRVRAPKAGPIDSACCSTAAGRWGLTAGGIGPLTELADASWFAGVLALECPEASCSMLEVTMGADARLTQKAGRELALDLRVRLWLVSIIPAVVCDSPHKADC